MKYPIILADPPWLYDRPMKGLVKNGATPYPTLTMPELRRVGELVEDVSADAALLFVWGTWPKINEALDFVRYCGFRYVTAAFIWVKRAQSGQWYKGMGQYTRSNTEYVLLGARGKTGELLADRTQEQIVDFWVTEHSVKPDKVQERIEAMHPGPRLELFARRGRPGWDCLGNEINGADIRDSLGSLALLDF